MTDRQQLLTFLREPKAFAAGAVDPEIWLRALHDFAAPQLAAKGEHALRPAQVEAWLGLAPAKAGLVLGPPGTGKTHLLAWLIVGYIQARCAAGLPARVFVSAFTRNAVGNLLDSVAKRAAEHAPGLFDTHFIGTAPPAGLAAAVLHRERIRGAAADDALADLQAPAVVVGGSIWSLAHLTARPGAGGDGFTADLFDLVCIDEASQLVVSHGLMALAGLKASGRVVVAGDDQQLPPIRSSRDISLGDRELGGSLYTFLKSGRAPEFALNETFRLNGPLAEFPERTFYRDSYRSVDEVRGARLDLIETWREGLEPWEIDLLDPEWPVAVVLHDGPPSATQNDFEATLAARLAGRLADRMVDAGGRVARGQSFWKDSLAIISPHRAQNAAIRKALPAALAKDAFVETVDRIQGKEREAIIMSYCVADAEFAVAEADFIFAPERLNVAVTRAKTKLIILVSRRLLDAVPSDQEAMDKAELLREFVFGAVPRREGSIDSGAVGRIDIQIRLRGFDTSPVFDESGITAPTAEPSDQTLSDDLSKVLAAVKAVSIKSASGAANIKELQAALATKRDLLPDLGRLHAQGWINLSETTRYGSYWTARILEPRRQVFPVDLETVRVRLEGVISQARSGRAPPFYESKIRPRFAWMNDRGEDVLRPVIDRLKDEGLVTFGTANGSLTVDWVDDDAVDEAQHPLPTLPPLSDDDFVVLNALETLEATTINFGVFEGWTSIASLADQAGLNRQVTAGAVGRLAADGWLLLADEGRIRSRMAELAREIRYVKQRFRHDDADARPYLVRSLKIELRDRDKPERLDRIAEVIATAAVGVSENHRRALFGLRDMLLQRWGAEAAVAGFQARSLISLTRAWRNEGEQAFAIAADTGSGKTEAAAFPLMAAAAADRLDGLKGVRAILAYPRIRLAINQAQRLAGYLADYGQQPDMPTLTLGLQVAQVPRSFAKIEPWTSKTVGGGLAREPSPFHFLHVPPATRTCCSATARAMTGQTS